MKSETKKMAKMKNEIAKNWKKGNHNDLNEGEMLKYKD